MTNTLKGNRFILKPEDETFPEIWRNISHPPNAIYGIGDSSALTEGLAVVGSRRITEYGKECTELFTSIAAKQGITIISGGARGCDTLAHKTALNHGCKTVAILGGGCDRIYPAENASLFQRIIDTGGCVISENEFDADPLPWMFRARNRLVASLAKATLIVEAGIPSGTFSTADEALKAGREVLAVPGRITSDHSKGTNKLIYQGATPIVDEEVFADQLYSIFKEES